jgi:5'-3' exonuclease
LGEFKEFDYIPYVIYKRFFKENDIGIVYSTDKDMYQLQSYTNCFEQLEKNSFPSKWHPGRLFINKENYVERILAKDLSRYELTNDDKEFIQNHFSLFRAIVGDSGDGVPGIKGIAYITFLKLFNKFSLKDAILSRSTYNDKIKKMDFSKFDFKKESVIYDLEKIENMEKEIKTSGTLKKLFDIENIKRVCMNLALMDYDIMYDRRMPKDKDEIDSKLFNSNKFRTNKEIERFINNTNLWNNHSYHKISISI